MRALGRLQGVSATRLGTMSRAQNGAIARPVDVRYCAAYGAEPTRRLRPPYDAVMQRFVTSKRCLLPELMHCFSNPAGGSRRLTLFSATNCSAYPIRAGPFLDCFPSKNRAIGLPRVHVSRAPARPERAPTRLLEPTRHGQSFATPCWPLSK